MGHYSLDDVLTAAKPLIKLAIREDIGPGDATSESTIDPKAILHGKILVKDHGVIAGLPIVEAVFDTVDPALQMHTFVDEGQAVVPGELVAQVSGPGASLLAAERIALNFLQRMSGIATATRRMVAAAATTKAQILDTRKTLPGYRILDKYAVRMGGGTNHRMSLYDMVMVKDNHIDGAGNLRLAVQRAREANPHLPIEVEVRDFDELDTALAIEPALDRILLDNMDLDELRQAVEITQKRIPLEASGGVTLQTVRDIAETGVDYISTGALTHSVKALDISMKIEVSSELDVDTLRARVSHAKQILGDKVVILGHHYERNEIIAAADYRGDSLQLARQATQTDADYIVFCGVHFMAETAATLAKTGQRVFIPDATAGCYLADTASLPDVEQAWAVIDTALADANASVTPITYVNSSAALKAFCGEHGGTVCTSGNAEEVLEWAFSQRERVFFFPDQHLGRNTAHKMGIQDEHILLWHRRIPPSANAIRKARVILWPGACNVHQRFRTDDVSEVRKAVPGIHVLVHPECKAKVVQAADDAGSTAYIIKQIEKASAGSKWAIGTESRLVFRLKKDYPQLHIQSLAATPPYCRTMSQITLANLAKTLEKLVDGNIDDEVTVTEQERHWAKVALERMLAL